MITAKSTFIPDSSRTDTYFCADEIIGEYEQKVGKQMTKSAKAVIYDFEELINEAYQDGYRDGMEDNK